MRFWSVSGVWCALNIGTERGQQAPAASLPSVKCADCQQSGNNDIINKRSCCGTRLLAAEDLTAQCVTNTRRHQCHSCEENQTTFTATTTDIDGEIHKGAATETSDGLLVQLNLSTRLITCTCTCNSCVCTCYCKRVQLGMISRFT